MQVVQEGPGTTKLYFWGRVVSESVGVLLPHKTTVPFEVFDKNEGSSCTMYLDGAQFMNYYRSDCCLAWHVSPVEATKPAKPAVSKQGAKGKATPKTTKDKPSFTHEISYEKSGWVTVNNRKMEFHRSPSLELHVPIA